jgi:heavy metal efflux system protein
VVMVEGLFVALDHRAKEVGMEKFNKLAKLGLFKTKGAEMGKAIFFSKIIILTCLIPIFAFRKVEGKMFSPLAYTLGFALLGALILTLTLVPALSSILLRKNVREKHNPVVLFFERGVGKLFSFVYRNQKKSLIVAFSIMILSFVSAKFLGSEFLPQLNEGALWVSAELPRSVSLDEAQKISSNVDVELRTFPEVRHTMVQVGRTNDGTDPKGFFNVQIAVDLAPQKEWKSKLTYDQLVDQMDNKLKKYPGIVFNYSQPIRDNVAEAVAGVPAALAVKIFGHDFNVLDSNANKVYNVLKDIKGVEDLGIIRNLGQPEFRIELNQQKMALYGVSTADANAVIEMAIGGKAATQLFEGERKFDIRVRYQEQYRNTQEAIESLMVPTLDGSKIPLKEVADIVTLTGPAFIYRDNNARYITVKFSVRGRDLGSTIAEAQEKVNKATGGTDLPADHLPDPVHHLRQCERFSADDHERAVCIDRWYSRPAYNWNELQHQRRHRVYCAVWCVYTERRDPDQCVPEEPGRRHAAGQRDPQWCDQSRTPCGDDRVDGRDRVTARRYCHRHRQ